MSSRLRCAPEAGRKLRTPSLACTFALTLALAACQPPPAFAPTVTEVLEGLEFDTGKATLRSSAFAPLDTVVAEMRRVPSARVRITAHTDNVGAPAANLELSRQRATAAKAYIVGKGIGADRIETEGVGGSRPIVDNRTAEGRQKNRRVEFTWSSR